MAFKPNDSGLDLKHADLLGTKTETETETKEEIQDEPVIEIDPQAIARQTFILSEDRVARRQLIMEIQRYYNNARFGQYLLKSGFVEELSTQTIDEMKNLLQDIRFTIQNKNSSEMIQRGVPQMIVAAEPLISRFYDVHGMGKMLLGSESFKDIRRSCFGKPKFFKHTGIN